MGDWSEGGPNTVFCLFSSWIQPVGHQLSLQPERLCLHPIDLVLTANEKSNDGHRFLIPIHLGMAFGPEMTLVLRVQYPATASPVAEYCLSNRLLQVSVLLSVSVRVADRSDT